MAATDERRDFHRGRQRGDRQHQPDRARQLLELQRGERERRIADDIAERDKNDPRDQEDQHEPESDQHIDRAGGNSILHQEKGDLRRHKLSWRANAKRAHQRRRLPVTATTSNCPFSSCTSTRARSSTPKKPPGLKL